MIFPAREVQRAYYAALNGAVTLGGQPVPVFDTVPSGQPYPYIVLTGGTANERSYNQGRFVTELVTDTDVVTGFEASYAGKNTLYSISEQVIAILRAAQQNFIPLTGVSLISTVLDSSVIIEEQTDTHLLHVQRLRFRHIIQET